MRSDASDILWTFVGMAGIAAYLGLVFVAVAATSSGRYGPALVIAAILVPPAIAGCFLWIRSRKLRERKRERREKRAARAEERRARQEKRAARQERRAAQD